MFASPLSLIKNVCIPSQLHLEYILKHLQNHRAKTSNVLIAGYEIDLRQNSMYCYKNLEKEKAGNIQ